MVTSYFRPKVEIWPFRACAMINTQYNPYLWPNSRDFRVLKEIGAEEHDGDVRFQTGSGNTTVLCMRNASGHNYWNSSFIMDVHYAKMQIPRSTERISSLQISSIKCRYLQINGRCLRLIENICKLQISALSLQMSAFRNSFSHICH